MRRGRRQHLHLDDKSGIDLAPMLDFVMNLLIFFIITAVFAKEMGLDVNRLGGRTAGGGESGSIVIGILADGEVIVDSRPVDIRAVRANVERLHAIKPEYGVMILAHPDSATGVLVQVADQVREGGVTNITFGEAK
jgi:biopolymer transport protein ExbD